MFLTNDVIRRGLAVGMRCIARVLVATSLCTAANAFSQLAFFRSDFTVQQAPYSIAVADLNGDAIPDLAVANYGSNSVSILMGTGDGSFLAGVTYTTGTGPSSVAVGDFNSDGHLDLAVAESNNGLDGTVSVLLGHGDGTFSSDGVYPVGLGPTSIVATDFDKDGKIDLAVGNFDGDSVSILLGNGDGTFQVTVDYPTGTLPSALAFSDFNGDGIVDLAVANFGLVGGTSVSILLGNGNGTFQPHVDYAAALLTDGVTVGDFNGDGKQDLAAANAESNTVSVLLGNGDGTFQNHVDYATAIGPSSVVSGDFDGDANIDLATADYNNGASSGFVSLLLGNGDGTFQTRLDYATGSGAQAVAAGDLNSDGRLDLATTNFTAASVSVLLQTTTSVSPASIAFPPQAIGTTSQPQTVTLTNLGSSNLTISSITISGPNASDFSQTNKCGSVLAAGASCSISVTFSPSTRAFLTATLTIADSALGSPQLVSLSGQGTRPFLNLSKTTVNFGNQQVGTVSQPQTVKLANTGKVTLIISKITLSGNNPGDFVETNTCGSSLPVRGQCTITVSFAPTAAGSRNASVVITDNAVGSPHTIRLQGTGTQ